MAQVLGKLTAGSLDGDNAGLDVDLNTFGNDKFVVLVNVLQEGRKIIYEINCLVKLK
jgi:hypothetical protein